MACAGLMNQTQQPLYFPLLDSPLSPSVRNLQAWIEAAWKEGECNRFLLSDSRHTGITISGFDKEGEKELKKLVNTKKWIGAAGMPFDKISLSKNP